MVFGSRGLALTCSAWIGFTGNGSCSNELAEEITAGRTAQRPIPSESAAVAMLLWQALMRWREQQDSEDQPKGSPIMTEDTIKAATEQERGTINALIAACTDFMALVMARTGPPTDQEVANALEAGAAFSVIVQLSPTVSAALGVQRPGEEPEIILRWVPAPAPTDVN